MKFSYTFSNLCGAVYRQGNVQFTNNGDSVFSPVGNRVSQFDLKRNKSWTYPFENRKNISCFAVSPNGLLMISVDEDGRALLVNLHRKVVLHHFNFKQPVLDIKFSPNGKFVVVTHGKSVQVWHAPGVMLEFAPFVLYRTFPAQYDDAMCITWSDDSNFLAVGSQDTSCRVYSLRHFRGFHYVNLAAHRSAIIACFFEHNSLSLYTVSKDGALVMWQCDKTLEEMQRHSEQRLPEKETTGAEDEDSDSDNASEQDAEEEGTNPQAPQQDISDEDGTEPVVKKRKKEPNVCHWEKSAKHLFHQEGRAEVSCATYHAPTHLLVVGFTSGIFTLYEMPDFNLIHSLSISQQKITSVAVNSSGEWLAFGCKEVGQLLVWEWQSESYIMRQQGHHYDMNVLAYSPDSQMIATGGDDGKVKLWNTTSGFCFVTFTEHTSAVTAVTFNHTGQVIVSASSDGTVRAFDMHRYRNFRTFASPRPVQFSCVALDPSSEVVGAGSLDTFEIFVWSMQTGKLLELLTGHEGPVCGLVFSPLSAILASCSWDKTCKLWDIFERKGNIETLQHSADVLCLAYRPDGEELAVASLDGQITFWNIRGVVQTGSVEGRRDLQVGRSVEHKVTAKHLSGGSCFTSLCYSADGKCILAGGRSKFVCIYEVSQQLLIRKFQISKNRSFDGMQQYLNSAKMTEAGPLDLLDVDSDSDKEDLSLPGVLKGDMSSRKIRPQIRTKCVQFSPTGRAWAAVSTEGLLIYSLDDVVMFDPFDLTIDLTPSTVKEALINREYTAAIVYSFRLNDHSLVSQAMEAVPVDDIQLIARSLSAVYVEKMVEFLAVKLETSCHLQFYLTWCSHLLTAHGSYLKEHSASIMSKLRDLQKSIVEKQNDLGSLCDGNSYLLQFIISLSKLSTKS